MTPDLSTRYLGLSLANPLVAAASPLCAQLSNLAVMEQSGVAAAVMMSIFQEQIEEEETMFRPFPELAVESHEDHGVHCPCMDDYNCGPDSYLRHLEAAKRQLSIPIIASLNGSRLGKWTRFAHLVEAAGADALELNIYFVPTSPETTGGEVEDRYLELVSAVRAECKIPLAVKLCDCFSALPNMAERLLAAGADGLVLFNRPLQPDINLDTFDVQPSLTLSGREELRSRLRWIAILRRHLAASLAASGGVDSAEDVLKLLLAGADVVMVASALLRHGPRHAAAMLQSMQQWLEQRGFQSIDQARGLVGGRSWPTADAFERAGYVRTITADAEHLRERS